MLRLKILLYKYNFKNRLKFILFLLFCVATLIFLLVFYLFIYDDFSYENYVCSKFKSTNQDVNDNQRFKDEDEDDDEIGWVKILNFWNEKWQKPDFHLIFVKFCGQITNINKKIGKNVPMWYLNLFYRKFFFLEFFFL